jgi:hypothetical protein
MRRREFITGIATTVSIGGLPCCVAPGPESRIDFRWTASKACMVQSEGRR